MTMWIALRCEFAKIRRTAVARVVFAATAFIGIVLNVFMAIAANPELAASMGLIGQKASIGFGGAEPGWALMALTLREISGLGGMLLSSFLLAWLFGREYLLGTSKLTLVAPIPRWQHALAKSLLALAWSIAALGVLWASASVAAALQGLPGDPWSTVGLAALSALPVAVAAWSVALPVAYVAVRTGGVFAPLGYAIGTLILSSVFLNLGWGPYVPWSAIGIMSGAGGAGIEANWASALVVAGTGALGFVLVERRMSGADDSA
jgi:ABC-2 type transport system permease protein